MSKMKTANCYICGKAIGRHDPNRITVKVGKGSNGQGVYRAVHLECSQEGEAK